MISISLCMIVRDEEQVLDRCLRGASQVAEELIIVDTGSEDHTRGIAGKYTEQVYEFPWEDDFSKARNFSFEKATKEYLLWLDADDVLTEDSVQRLKELKETLPRKTDIVMMPYVTAFDPEGNALFFYDRERIVRNTEEYRFEGRVHEAIPLKGHIFYSSIPVEHRKSKNADGRRNLRIYRKMEQEGVKFQARELYYYGRELLNAGKFREGADKLECFLKREDAWRENQIDGTRQLAKCYERMGREEERLHALLRGLSFDVPRGETACELGRCFLERGELEQAAYWYHQALSAKKAVRAGAFIQEECYGYLPAISLCVCYDRMGEFEKAEAYNELAGKFQPYSQYYLQNRVYFQQRKEAHPV